MSAEFEWRPSPSGRDEGQMVEYVKINVGDGTVSHRRTTDDDRRVYSSEYQAFRASSPPTDASLAKVRGEIVEAVKTRADPVPAEDAATADAPAVGEDPAPITRGWRNKK